MQIIVTIPSDIYTTEQIPSWDKNNSTAGQTFPRILSQRLIEYR